MEGRLFQYMVVNGDEVFEARKEHAKGVEKGDIGGGGSGKDRDKGGGDRIGETRGAHAS